MDALVVLMVASLFRIADPAPVFIQPLAESFGAAVGKPANFSFRFTGDFEKIQFGPSDGSNFLDIAIKVTKATPLTFDYLPKYKDRISWAGNIKVSQVEAVFILSNISRSDSGYYGCKVTGGGTSISRHVELTVTDANIVEHPKSAVCQTSGGEVNFTCNATGTPYPNVTWVKGEEEIGESSLVKIVRDGKGYSRLTIKNCGREDVLARYRCKATNPPDLEVFSRPAVLFFNFIINDTTLVEKKSSPSSVTGAIGVETTLRCAFRSYPPPSIHWTTPNGDSKQTTLPFLSIKPMSSEEFGIYTCSARGFTTRTMRLMEEEKDFNTTYRLKGRSVQVTWPKDERAEYYTVTGTGEELKTPFLAIADNNTYEMILHRESVTTIGNKKDFNISLVVRALSNSLNKVVNRTLVTLVSKARSLEAGFLEIVIASAVGLLSAGFQ